MILDEIPSTPRNIPALAHPSAPIYRILNRPGDTVLTDKIAGIVGAYNQIPAAIRTAFEAWGVTPQGRKTRYRIWIGDQIEAWDQFGNGFGRRVGDVQWAGFYNADGLVPPGGQTCVRTESDADVSVIVHEFGHHVDWTYARLWGSGGATRVINTEPFASLWTASYPTIPSTLYAAANKQEWFAESFRSMVYNIPVNIFNNAGQDQARADQLAAAFEALLPPLPPMVF